MSQCLGEKGKAQVATDSDPIGEAIAENAPLGCNKKVTAQITAFKIAVTSQQAVKPGHSTPTHERSRAQRSDRPLTMAVRRNLRRPDTPLADAKSQCVAEWLTWPDFGTFWSQVICHAMRKSESKGVFVEIERHGETARVTVDTVDVAGRYVNEVDTQMTLIRPDLGSEKVTLAQTAPGRYEAEFVAAESGSYHLELSQRQNGQVTFRQSRGVVVGYPDELRLGKPDGDLLRSVAELSGGEYEPTVEQIFDPSERLARQVLRLWPTCLSRR